VHAITEKIISQEGGRIGSDFDMLATIALGIHIGNVVTSSTQGSLKTKQT
jgi:hypothetical protein